MSALLASSKQWIEDAVLCSRAFGVEKEAIYSALGRFLLFNTYHYLQVSIH